MPEKNTTHGVTGAATLGWSLTVKPASGQAIKGFWLVHSGNTVATQTYNNPTPIPGAGILLSPNLQSTGSKDGWTIVYMDINNNLWSNGDFLQGSGSGLYDLPNDESYSNCAITITLSAPNSGSASVNISWSYFDGQQQQTGSLSPLTGYQNINKLD